MADLTETTPEPSVLDWLKSLLRLKPLAIPERAAAAPFVELRPVVALPTASTATQLDIRKWAGQLRLPVALLLAFLAQVGLEQHKNVQANVLLYLLAGGLVGWSLWAGELDREAEKTKAERSWRTWIDLRYLTGGIILSGLTYLASGDNTFRFSTLVFWVLAILATGRAFWQGKPPPARLMARVRKLIGKPRLNIAIGGPALLAGAAFLLAAGFRYARLAEVPFEMTSDHAEKILDIIDVLNGETSIFFPRNAGREAMQFYSTAAAVRWFGAELNFLTLKQVTATAGLLALPFIYLFGREIGGRKVGLASMALTGIAYWPNVIGRVGLRATFYPLLLAPTLYFLVRGLRARRQNDFVLCGFFLGASIYSYTAARLAPLVVVLAVLLYLLHRESKGHRREALRWLGVAALMTVVVAVPFLRAAYQLPDQVFFRTVTRVTEMERAIEGSVTGIFLNNVLEALKMFSWDFGEIWVLSIPFRPALDWVTGGLFHLGVVLLIVRYAKSRNWLDLFLPLSILLLILPSVLALAFPGENPHPSRAGGAIIPVFAIAATSLVGIEQWGIRRLGGKTGQRIGAGFAGALFLLTAVGNYSLGVTLYGEHMRRGAWNASELGTVAHGFGESVGSFSQIYIMAFPHWLDSRLVAVAAGRPGQDFGIWPEQVSALEPTTEARLFFLHPMDENGHNLLRELFPTGILSTHRSQSEGKDFDVYFVPPASSAGS
ncbi:MAG TPA: glycosyltransferase family 39 protein [Anaerolineales bacterium]